MSAEDTWYVGIDGNPQGPFPFSWLEQQEREGHLRPESLIWTPGMANWTEARNVDGLFQKAQAAPVLVAAAVTPRRATKPRTNLISKPTSVEEADEAVKGGAYAGYAFAGMQVIGGVYWYTTGRDALTREALVGDEATGALVGSLIVAGAIAGLSYWFRIKPRFVIPLLLGLCFAGEIIVKMANGDVRNVWWFLFYGAIAAGFISGVRGALYFRRIRKEEEALIRATQLKAEGATLARPYNARAQTTAAARKSNFIVRHWRGELKLPVSYWVVGIGVSLLAVLLGEGMGQFIAAAEPGPEGVGVTILMFLSTLLVLMVWQLVGTWRSAGRHIRETGRSVWGMLARVAIVLGVLQLGMQFKTYGPLLHRSAELAMGMDNTPQYQLRLLRAGTEVELYGGMATGAADALKSILDAAPAIQVVHLNSVGGWVAEGYKLNKLMHERKLATYTSTECVSACTVAFLGGAARYLSPGGRLGFHSSSFGSIDGESDPELNREMIATLREHGAPAWFIKKAFDTPPSGMWYPTQQELLDSGIVTQIVDANQFALSGTGSLWKDSAAARSVMEDAMRDDALMAVLKQSEPEAYEKLLVAMTQGVTEGRTIVDIQHEIYKTVMVELLPKYLKGGNGPALRAYWSVQVDEIRYLTKNNPKACTGFVLPETRDATWDTTRLLPAELLKSDLAALAALLRAGISAELTAASYSPADEELVAIFERTEKLAPGAAAILENPKQFTNQPDALCRAFSTFYAQVLAMPPERSAVMMRYLSTPE